MRVVKAEKEKLEAVSEFCYQGDMLSAGGCCELAAVTPCKCDKGKFCYLPLPFSPTVVYLPLADRDRVYSTCVKNVRLHALETWAMTAATHNSLWRNELAHFHWICNVKVKDEFI